MEKVYIYNNPSFRTASAEARYSERRRRNFFDKITTDKERAMGLLPKINSCFAVIIEENQTPPRFYLVHNNADPLGPNGEEGKPAGCGLPGGGSLEDEKPYEEEVDFSREKFGGTVRREVLGEAGLLTEIATRGGKNSEFGEILFESKPDINNDIFIFHLKVIGSGGFGNIKETDETGIVMLADLGRILMMPLAVKVIRRENGDTEKTKNPEGIYFSTRDRIFGVLEYLGYNFCELIPDLDKLFKKIKREEVGNYIYNLLDEAIAKKNKLYERRAKFLRLDLEDPDDLNELLERYQPQAVRQGG